MIYFFDTYIFDTHLPLPPRGFQQKIVPTRPLLSASLNGTAQTYTHFPIMGQGLNFARLSPTSWRHLAIQKAPLVPARNSCGDEEGLFDYFLLREKKLWSP